MQALTCARLSKGRRKRAVPRDWATSDEIESYHVISTSQPLGPGSSSVAIDNSGERVIVGGLDGNAAVCSLLENKIVQVLNIDGGVSTDVAWAGSRPVVSSSSGAVKVFDDGNQIASFNSHAGAANAIALHPSGEILASVGVDKSFVFYDLINLRPVTQIYADCGLSLKYRVIRYTDCHSSYHCCVSSRWPTFCGWWYRWPDQTVSC